MLPLGTDAYFRSIQELTQHLLLRVLSVLMLRKEKGEAHEWAQDVRYKVCVTGKQDVCYQAVPGPDTLWGPG